MTLSLRSKIYALIAATCLGMLCLVAGQFFSLKGALEHQKRVELRHLVELATSILHEENEKAKDGRVTVESAKAQALARLSTLRFGSNDYFWVNDNRPNMVMHPIKPELNGTDLSQFADPTGHKLFLSFVETVRQSGSGYVGYEWPKPGSPTPQPKLSYVSGFAPWGWIVGTGMYIDDVYADVWAATMRELKLLAGVLLTTTLASLGIARSLTRSVSGMTQAMRALADGDTSIVLPSIKSRDELAAMAEALEVFRANAIERSRLEQLAAEEVTAKLALNAKINALLDSFKLSSDNVLTATAQNMSDLASTSKHLTQLSTVASEQADVASSATTRTAESVQTVAAAAEQLSASISEIDNRVAGSREIISKATETTNRSAREIEALSTAGQQIGSVVGLIQNVAKQTHLLALNATIEAARAGEAGKGFAVVAGEVKALAEQTSQATSDITRLINSIQQSTGTAVSTMREIAANINDINEVTGAIALAVEHQGAATREIAQSANSVATQTDTLRASVDSVTGVITQTQKTADGLIGVSMNLSDQANSLSREVETFMSVLRTGPLDRRAEKNVTYGGRDRRAGSIV